MTNSIYINPDEANAKKEAYFEALYSRQMERVANVLKADPDAILYVNNMRDSGLHRAIKQKNVQLLKALLSFAQKTKVIDKLINGRDYEGKTPLNVAAEMNDFSAVQALLPHQPDLYLMGYDFKRNPMHFAALNNNTEIAQALKNAGMSLDKKALLNPFGVVSPIHFAAANYAPEMVEFFIENGVDENLQTHSGKTPLMIALQSGCEKVVSVLVDKKVDVVLQDKSGHNALWYARQYNAYSKDARGIKALYEEQMSGYNGLLKVVRSAPDCSVTKRASSKQRD